MILTEFANNGYNSVTSRPTAQHFYGLFDLS